MAETRKAPPSTRPPWHRDPIIRGYIYQVLLILLVIGFGYFIFNNTLHNMEKRNIKTGFSFLNSEAGFGILFSLIEYNASFSYGRTFVVGLLNTILVSTLGIVFATTLGFVMGVSRLSTNWIVAKVAKYYVEIFRNIPLLIQIMFWYSVVVKLPSARNSIAIGDWFFLSNRGFYTPAPVFEEGFGAVTGAMVAAVIVVVFLARWARKKQELTGEQFPVFRVSLAILIFLPGIVFLVSGSPLSWSIPALKGFNFKGGASFIPELMALLIALTVYTGTFIAETVRAGIQAVDHGQSEAAHALGLRQSFTIRLIIMPQALRVIIPPLTSQYLNLTKNSSLATAIGYPDLVAVFAGTTLNQTGQAVEIIAMTMAVYLSLSLTISVFMNWYNKKIALVER
ncbi:MAG: amino acid ABC transporter permease [SAR324 cluster bacterium]|nr:amino acid ABC transporter permease [SAR324 cluster bacterium]